MLRSLPSSLPPCRLLFVTAPPSEATSLALGLVENELCACVNLLPSVSSVYRWEGKVISDQESLLVIKTTEAGVPAVREWIEANHSYDTPEVLSVDIDTPESSHKYIEWLVKSVK